MSFKPALELKTAVCSMLSVFLHYLPLLRHVQ